MTLRSLRIAWALLGVLLALRVATFGALHWTLVAALGWLLGLAAVASRERGDRVVVCWQHVASWPAAATAALILGLGLIPLAALAFSAFAALGTSAWLGALALWLSAPLGARRLGEALIALSTAGSALALVLGAAELTLRLPPIAHRLGTSPMRHSAPSVDERNLFGFRSPHERVARRPGVLRVLALGDSFTWGDRLARSVDAWPARLEAGLRARHGPDSVEVINMGRKGFTTLNEAELLRRIGWQFEPDLVVVQFLANDALPSGPDFEHVSGEWLRPTWRLLPVAFREGLAGDSVLLKLLEDRLTELIQGSDSYLRYLDLYAEDAPGWAQLRSALHEMGSAAEERGVPIVLLLFPHILPGEWTLQSYPLRPIHEQVGQEAAAAGFRVLDLAEVFAAAGGDWRRWWATPYDAHPSAEAHALVADALLERSEREDWIEGLAAARPPSEERPLPALACPDAAETRREANARFCVVRGPDGEPLRHGPFVRWSKTGAKQQEGEYRLGRKQGLWSEWFDSGRKRSQLSYREGVAHGEWIQWYENGEARARGAYRDGEEDGVWTLFFEDGRRAEEGPMRDGRREGRWLGWHRNGEPRFERSYVDGRAVAWREWDASGRVVDESDEPPGSSSDAPQ